MIYSWEIEADPFKARVLYEIYLSERKIASKKALIEMSNSDTDAFDLLSKDLNLEEIKLSSLKICLDKINNKA